MPSDTLTAAERKRIVATSRESRKRGERLAVIAARLCRCADELDAMVVGDEATTALHGEQIAAKLAELIDVGEVWHYRDLLDLLRACGFEPGGVSGKDTLLANLSRSKHFEGVGHRTGQYRRVA